jgi:hypothetical protein
MVAKNGAKKNDATRIRTLRSAVPELSVAFGVFDRAIREAGLRNKVVFTGDVRVRSSVGRRYGLLCGLNDGLAVRLTQTSCGGAERGIG